VPVIPPSPLGQCAEFSDLNPGGFPYPPTGDATGIITFDFTAFDASDELRIVVFSYEGDSVSDTAGNTYALDLTAGFLKVWSALVEYMPDNGVDSITVTEGFGFNSFVLDSTDPVNYLGPRGSTEGLAHPTYPGPFSQDADSPAITLPEAEDWLFGGFAYRLSNFDAFTGALVTITDVDDLPESPPTFSFVGSLDPSDAADEIPPDPITDYTLWRGEVYGIGPSEVFDPPATGPYHLGCTVGASIIGDALNPTLTYDLDWTAFVIAYRGKGVTGPWPPEEPGPGDGPWNLETRGGRYQFSYPEAGVIQYRSSVYSGPIFVTSSVVTGGGDDSQFRMCAVSYPAGRVRGVWRRAGAVVGAHSDDDGNTWSSPVTLWATAKNPTVAYDPRSETLVYAAYVTDHLEARVQGPSDSSPGTAFHLTDGSADLAVDDATFHIQPAYDTPGRWLLVLVDGGTVKNFQSVDDCESWDTA